MSSQFNNNKIKGIFYKRSGYAFGKKNDTKNIDRFFLEDIKKLLDIDLPKTLTRSDINKLLRDRGRNYLHSLVSEAVDKCTYWKQILTTLQDKIGNVGTFTRFDSDLSDIEIIADGLLDVNYMFFLWKHRLSILEMIARAQHSYEFEQQQWTLHRH